MATKIPLEYLDLSNDFGFTAVHETDLTEPIISEVKTTANDATKQKLLDLDKLILPLLVNLMKNPEKDYIYWPKRTAKIDQFEDVLRKIIEG